MFKRHADEIGTFQLEGGLTSDEVLAVLRADLVALGFDVEGGQEGRRQDQASGVLRRERPAGTSI